MMQFMCQKEEKMKFDDDHKQEWEELEFDEPDAQEESNTSVEDQVDEAVQKLVRDTISEIPEHAYGSGEEDPEDDEEEYIEEEDEEEDEPRRKSGKKNLLIFGIAAALVLVLLVGFYGYRTFYFTNHFFEGTVINGMDCGGMTAAQVEDQIRENAADYTLDIHFRNGDQQIVGSSIDYQYQSSGSVQALLKEQNAFAWLTENSRNRKHEVSVQMQYDETKLNEQVSHFQQMQEDQMEAPVDAKVEFLDGKFVAAEATQGTQLDVAKAKEAIAQAVAQGAQELEMESAGVYLEPAVSSDDTNLEEQAAQLNELVSASVTYQLPDGQAKVLDGTTLKDWLSCG